TIRSRCVSFALSAMATEEVEEYLKTKHPDIQAKPRKLIARLSEKTIGRAKDFNLTEYIAAHTDTLTLLQITMQTDNHSSLFKTTDSYRSGAKNKAKTKQLIQTLYSLLEDLLLLRS